MAPGSKLDCVIGLILLDALVSSIFCGSVLVIVGTIDVSCLVLSVRKTLL